LDLARSRGGSEGGYGASDGTHDVDGHRGGVVTNPPSFLAVPPTNRTTGRATTTATAATATVPNAGITHNDNDDKFGIRVHHRHHHPTTTAAHPPQRQQLQRSSGTSGRRRLRLHRHPRPNESNGRNNNETGTVAVHAEAESSPAVSVPVPQQQQQQHAVGVVPRHVAFICDGNSRWAERRNLPTSFGHAKGADRFLDLVGILQNTEGIDYCTVYGFSSENWNRPAPEIRNILLVMERTARTLLRLRNRHDNKQRRRPQKRPGTGGKRSHGHSEEGDAATHNTGTILSRVRCRILGDLDDPRIPTSLRDVLNELQRDDHDDDDEDDHHHDVHGDDDDDEEEEEEEETTRTRTATTSGTATTAGATPLTVCLAINYGGRQDLVRACQRLVDDAVRAATATASTTTTASNDNAVGADGGAATTPTATAMANAATNTRGPRSHPTVTVTEATLAGRLSTGGMPYPDLIVRTSGEHRLSNFLLWEAAYAELYLTDELWPDFGRESWRAALEWYGTRKRRFGGRSKDGGNDDNRGG
jgi:undecaprenyl pyrophosphate synthase